MHFSCSCLVSKNHQQLWKHLEANKSFLWVSSIGTAKNMLSLCSAIANEGPSCLFLSVHESGSCPDCQGDRPRVMHMFFDLNSFHLEQSFFHKKKKHVLSRAPCLTFAIFRTIATWSPKWLFCINLLSLAFRLMRTSCTCDTCAFGVKVEPILSTSFVVHIVHTVLLDKQSSTSWGMFFRT